MGHPRMKAADNIQTMLLYNDSLKFKEGEMIIGKTNIGPTPMCLVFFSFSSSLFIGTELARIFPRL